jgi:hypothetical protein
MTSRASATIAATGWVPHRARRAQRPGGRPRLVRAAPVLPPPRFSAGGSALRDAAGGLVGLAAAALGWGYFLAAVL